ncbi:MAG: hypothetical protein IAI50_07215 [Candidatus Eremiobacteraeota bacterium]|nr:hypothetical protein [Candidatus Eremiobacteraeota bacterium]
MDPEVLIPLAAIFCLFGLPVLAFISFRVLAHRERMEMIRNGVVPSGPAPKEWRRAAQSATVRTPTSAAADQETADSAQCTLRKGITLSFIGFALTLGLSFIGFSDDKWSPGPWLLGGLIPMFVGLAQVTIALISGATLGQLGRRPEPQTYYGAPPPPPPAQSGPMPDFESSYTYRSGMTQELRPPTSPPERRS